MPKCALLLERAVNVNQLPHFEQGWATVQDAHAQWSAELLGAENGETVLDACAAPGGKTTHILEKAPKAKAAKESKPAKAPKEKKTNKTSDVQEQGLTFLEMQRRTAEEEGQLLKILFQQRFAKTEFFQNLLLKE